MLTSFLNLYAAVTLTTPQNVGVISYEDTIPASMIPVKIETSVAPVVKAKGAIIVDFDSGKILFEQNSDEKLQIASITKLMTAIVALENADLNETVNVSKKAANTEGSKVWLYTGENITLHNLLKAVLIHSGNDAAVAVAEHVGGDVQTFVDMMNEKAKELKLFSTHYANPIGFDDLENYSTVKDLAQLARYAFRKPFVRESVGTKTMTISSINGELIHELESTNEMLNSFLNVLGLKTGHTEAAGLCFVSIIENGKGNKIITVVLDSPDRFKETKILATWAFRSYKW